MIYCAACVESKSHPLTATLTPRKNSPGDDDDLMLLGMMFAIDLVVEHVVDTGSLDFLSRLKLFLFGYAVGFLLGVELTHSLPPDSRLR